MIKDIRTERIQQKWITESTEKAGRTDLGKEHKVVEECPGERCDVHSPETPHAVPSPDTLKVTVENTTATQVTAPDFLGESSLKIKMSPILQMLADDNAEKEGTVKGEENKGQNMDVQEKMVCQMKMHVQRMIHVRTKQRKTK